MMYQSITGPLKNWKSKDWQHATSWIKRNDGTFFTAEELRAEFQRLADAGITRVPYSRSTTKSTS